MSERSPHLYQSGERIPVTGTYVMVTVRSEPTTASNNLEGGEYFPHHDGWSVCWYLMCAGTEKERPLPALFTPAGEPELPFC